MFKYNDAWPHESGSGSTLHHFFIWYFAVLRIRIQLNPDLAKNLNPDPDPSIFLTLSKNNTVYIYLFHNYTISSSKEVN